MSIDFTIVCARPLPDDWRLGVLFEGLPFHCGLGEIDALREETLEWLDETDAAGTFEHEVARRLGRPWSFVVHLNCRPAAAELTRLCAEELTARFGGFFFDDHAAELSPVREGAGGATGAEVVAAWTALRDDHRGREERLRAEAARQWRQAAAREHAAYAEANDWSDVAF